MSETTEDAPRRAFNYAGSNQVRGRALCGGYCRFHRSGPDLLSHRDPACPVHGDHAGSRGVRMAAETRARMAR